MVKDKFYQIKDAESRKILTDMYSSFYKEIENDGDSLSREDKSSIERMTSSLGTSDNDWGFFVEDGESPAGFILCHKYNNAASEHIRPGDVEIESFVNKQSRGKGLGKLLKEIAIDSISNSCNGKPARAISFVEKTNEVNLEVLKKTGFREIRGSKYNGDPGRTYSIYAKNIL